MRTAWPATRSASAVVEPVRAGEAPRAVDEDANAEAFRLAGGDALDPAGLDRDRFVHAADDAHVGVLGAEMGGRIQGSVGQVAHREGEGSRGVANGVSVECRIDTGTCYVLLLSSKMTTNGRGSHVGRLGGCGWLTMAGLGYLFVTAALGVGIDASAVLRAARADAARPRRRRLRRRTVGRRARHLGRGGLWLRRPRCARTTSGPRRSSGRIRARPRSAAATRRSRSSSSRSGLAVVRGGRGLIAWRRRR